MLLLLLWDFLYLWQQIPDSMCRQVDARILWLLRKTNKSRVIVYK